MSALVFRQLVRRFSGRGDFARNLRLLENVIHAVKATVHREGRYVIPGFVTFNVRTTKTRKILNPITGERMQLPARKSVRVRASSTWRGAR
jgi:nucleoid DNA-binding protein